MPGFTYFVQGGPNKTGRDILADMGLAHAFDAASSVQPSPVIGKGPSGEPGTIYFDDSIVRTTKLPRINATDAQYHPDRQKWRVMLQPEEGPWAGKVWVGYVTDKKPQPADLVRSSMLDGELVTLGDDNDWHVPVARHNLEENGQLVYRVRFPCVAKYQGGEWVETDVVARYRSLWAIACTWYDFQTLKFRELLLESAGKSVEDLPEEQQKSIPKFTFDNMASWAVEVLRVNYVSMGPTEIEILELFDTDRIGKVLDALVELETFFDWTLKKNDGLKP